MTRARPPVTERGSAGDAERTEGPSDLLEQVRREGLLAPGRPLVVLLSGGRDSTCLLDVAVRIADPELVQALHVNYGLREAADEDERHCNGLCEALGVRLHARRARAPALREVHPAAEENVLALAGILREEAEVLDGLVDRALGGGRKIELEALRQLPSAVRRLVVQRLADLAAGRPAPGTARRADEVA